MSEGATKRDSKRGSTKNRGYAWVGLGGSPKYKISKGRAKILGYAKKAVFYLIFNNLKM